MSSETMVIADDSNAVEALKVGHQTVNLATPVIAGSSPAHSTNYGAHEKWPQS